MRMLLPDMSVGDQVLLPPPPIASLLCYAISGTERCYGTPPLLRAVRHYNLLWCYACCSALRGAKVLRLWYARSGTELGMLLRRRW
eukprot:1825023-Rhodomonas_salina.1